mgnify:CR=1 FL=1
MPDNSATSDQAGGAAGARPLRDGPGAARRGVLRVLGRLSFGALALVGAIWTWAAARFLMPNAALQPTRRFKVGSPAEYPPDRVETRYQSTHGVWIVHGRHRGARAIYALDAACTHLGCMTLWRENEGKFKCPCHGSAFTLEGLNVEGPAPRPLVRLGIRLAEDGQLEVDRSQVFRGELGQWDDPRSYLPT